MSNEFLATKLKTDISVLSVQELEFYLLAKFVSKKANNRKIVTWGKVPVFEKILMNFFGLKVDMVITSREDLVKTGIIEFRSKIINQSDQYYIVGAHEALLLDHFFIDSKKYLQTNGYQEFQNFIFRRITPIVIEHYDLAKGEYHDDFGNIIKGGHFGKIAKVIFRGFNNHLTVGENIAGLQNVSVDFSCNSKISIGSGTKFRGKTEMNNGTFRGTRDFNIGSNCAFGSTIVKLWDDIKADIGECTTFGSNLFIDCSMSNNLKIGRDCMFSYNVIIFTGDGHTIFDVNTGNVINCKPNVKRKDIVLSDHVWVGHDVSILSGTRIGSGSILGANAVVKGVFPNNCSVYGNPAKIGRKDIAWSRNPYVTKVPNSEIAYYNKTINDPLQ